MLTREQQEQRNIERNKCRERDAFVLMLRSCLDNGLIDFNVTNSIEGDINTKTVNLVIQRKSETRQQATEFPIFDIELKL